MDEERLKSLAIQCITQECPDLSIFQRSVISKNLALLYAAAFESGWNGHASGSSRPVLQIKDGVIVYRWDSAAQAARGIGVTKSTISKAANSETKYCRNFNWIYEDEYK
jgi:hypothetical protein